MAIKYNNDYFKIISLVLDYTTGTSAIYAKVYATEIERLREKLLYEKTQAFKENAIRYIEQLSVQFRQKVLEQVPENEALTYVENTPDLKQELDYIDAISLEYRNVLYKVLLEDISLEELQYTELWYSLGLEDNMLIAIASEHFPQSFQFEGLFENTTLEYLYTRLKEHFPESEDC